MCSTGNLVHHWDPSWCWAQLQLVAAAHGPSNTLLLLTAARVLFLVAHTGGPGSSIRSSSSIDPTASGLGSDSSSSKDQRWQQQQVLAKFSVKVRSYMAAGTWLQHYSGCFWLLGS
jgi:hypothetical protein